MAKTKTELAELKTAGFSALECAPLGFQPSDFAAAFGIRPDAQKLFRAAQNGNEDEVRILLAAGAEPDGYKVSESVKSVSQSVSR